MNMPQTIIQNLEYFLSEGVWKTVQDNSADKTTFLDCATIVKISLFSGLDEPVQDNDFKKILDNTEHQLLFSKINEEMSLIWNCFVRQQDLQMFLQVLIQQTSFDYLTWPISCATAPKLIVFDMDSTFIQIEVIDELAKAHNVGVEVSKVTESAMRGELDFSESLITRVACLKGLSSDTIEDIANNLPLSPGVDSLVNWAHQHDIRIAIVSGGFTPFVKKLAVQMNLFKVKANDLEIVNNKLTGKVLGDIVDAQAKADFVNQLKQQLNLQTNEIMSIGDGANDLLMMKETGFSLAYRAKPAVDKEAGGRMKTTYLDRLISVFYELTSNKLKGLIKIR